MIPKVRHAMAVSLVMVLLLMPGCAGMNRQIEAPKVHFSGIQLQDISGFESTFRVDLRVINGNPVPLAIEGISCDLTVNDKRFASGVSGKHWKIPAYGTGVVSIDLYSSMFTVLRGILTMEQKDTVDYVMAGRVQLGGGARPSMIPFQISGTLDAATLQ